MSTINQVLDRKGGEIFTVSPSDSVYDAVKHMAENSIGTVLVLDGKKIAGIMSERDFTRKVVVTGRCGEDLTVADIMTRNVIFAKPDSPVDECLQLMTDERIRHLPVLNGDEIIGVLSMGDLVKYKLGEQDAMIRHYEKYIYEGY